MQTNHIVVSKTARYHTWGALNNQCTDVWIVLHGYRQLASNFIAQFKPLLNQHTAIVAPEALHRFYIDNAHKKVGASWMTKEDRDLEIRDYTAYLNDLYRYIQSLVGNECRFHVLGFSQGVATATRWIHKSKFQIQTLVLYAGGIAHEIELDSNTYLKQIPLKIVSPQSDTIVKPMLMELQYDQLSKYSFNVELLKCEGDHRITEDGLQKIIL